MPPLLLSFLLSVVYIAGGGILANIIGEALPRRVFRPESALYRPRRWERDGKCYEKFGIRRWKDHVPDMSRVRKKKMVSKHLGTEAFPTAERVRILAQETCRAETVHAVLCLLSPLILLFWIGPWIGLGVAVVVVYVFCNLPFIMIQRYNRPPLVALEARLRRREARRAEKRPEPEKEGNRQDESSDPLG